MKSTQDYLLDLLTHIERVEQVAAAGEDQFRASFIHQDSIIRNYEIIGEIVKRLPDNLLAKAPHIEWGQIRGFRDFLAHNYDKVDLDIVWSAVSDLPSLKAAVQTLLKSSTDNTN